MQSLRSIRTGIGLESSHCESILGRASSSEGACVQLTPSSPLCCLHLPRLKCPRGTFEKYPKDHLSSPRTPRRRHGWLAAGAATTFFTSRSFSDNSFLFGPTLQSLHLCARRWGEPSHVPSASRGDQEADVDTEEMKRKVSVERSGSVNEELLLFFFQLDLTTRLQKALNQDQYEAAQQMRERISEVEQEIVRQREAKMGASAKDEAQDKSIIMLRIKAEMQKAVEEEHYAEAAALRDSLSKLESDTLAASAAALAFNNVTYQYRLGQKVRHKVFGYRGVICGMDPMCCESESWMQAAGIDKLARGGNQPFYQVLVDMRQDPGFVAAYVAEEFIVIPDEPDTDRFDHPYIYLLFYGMDGNGDFIPSKQLREKYNAPRHELPSDEDEDESDSGNLSP
eukprot:jgi/Mesen1/1698/ME000138S00557